MSYRSLWLLGVLGLGACATGTNADDVDARGVATDGAEGDGAEPDGATTDGAVTDGSEIDARAIDAASIDAPAIDGGIDAPPTGPVDTCAQALDITAMAMGATGVTLTGTTVGYTNDVSPPSSCTGYTAAGPDAIYRLDLAAGRTITATAMPTSSWDIALILVTPCAATPTCLRGADVGFAGTSETATYTTTAAGVVYVVVDGFLSTTSGPYSLNVRVQ